MKNSLKVQRAILDLTQEELAKKSVFHVRRLILLKKTGMYHLQF